MSAENPSAGNPIDSARTALIEAGRDFLLRNKGAVEFLERAQSYRDLKSSPASPEISSPVLPVAPAAGTEPVTSPETPVIDIVQPAEELANQQQEEPGSQDNKRVIIDGTARVVEPSTETPENQNPEQPPLSLDETEKEELAATQSEIPSPVLPDQPTSEVVQPAPELAPVEESKDGTLSSRVVDYTENPVAGDLQVEETTLSEEDKKELQKLEKELDDKVKGLNEQERDMMVTRWWNLVFPEDKLLEGQALSEDQKVIFNTYLEYCLDDKHLKVVRAAIGAIDRIIAERENQAAAVSPVLEEDIESPPPQLADENHEEQPVASVQKARPQPSTEDYQVQPTGEKEQIVEIPGYGRVQVQADLSGRLLLPSEGAEETFLELNQKWRSLSLEERRKLISTALAQEKNKGDGRSLLDELVEDAGGLLGGLRKPKDSSSTDKS